jgi:hypothetical protein
MDRLTQDAWPPCEGVMGAGVEGMSAARERGLGCALLVSRD